MGETGPGPGVPGAGARERRPRRTGAGAAGRRTGALRGRARALRLLLATCAALGCGAGGEPGPGAAGEPGARTAAETGAGPAAEPARGAPEGSEAGPKRRATSPPADLILVGRIHTLESVRPAEALAVREGRVAAVGARERVEALRGEGTRTVVLGEGVALPAFVDHHVHLLNVGLSLLNRERDEALHLDLTGLASLEELEARVRRRARTAGAEGWILGKGWSQAAWGTQALPDRAVLDRAAPERPVYLTRIDGHAGWANGAALEAAGIGPATEDPEGGRILRRPDGEPTGVLLERANEPLVARLPALPDSDVVAAFRRATGALAARGVVEAYDAGFLAPPGVVALNVDLGRYYRLLVRADREEPLPVRVHVMVPAPSALADSAVAHRDAWRRPSPRVDVTHLKLFADGALGSRGAALSHPYADDPGTRGVPRMTAAGIRSWSERALDAGLDVAVHAIGDEAVRRTLEAFEGLLRDRPGLDPRRLRVEHFSYASEEDLGRAVRLGVVISMQSNFNSPSDARPSFAARRVGEARAPLVYPWRRLHREGALLAEGSDYFGLPGPALANFHAALTTRNGLGTFGPGPEGRLEALRLQARHVPPGGGVPREPRLRPGDPADLAVLSGDPLRLATDDLPGVRVRATLRGGRVVHRDGTWPEAAAGPP